MCAISKAHKIVSHHTTKETPTEALIARVTYNLVQMAPAYNNNQWISHFRDYHMKMNFIYTHHTKGQAIAIVESFLDLIKSQYQLSSRYFQTNGETSLEDEFNKNMTIRGIITKRTTPYTLT
jgi:hypothetical protein